MAAKIDVDGREFSSELEREYGFNKADTRCRVENWLPVLQLRRWFHGRSTRRITIFIILQDRLARLIFQQDGILGSAAQWKTERKIICIRMFWSINYKMISSNLKLQCQKSKESLVKEVEEVHPGSGRSESVARNQIPWSTNRIFSLRGLSVAFTNTDLKPLNNNNDSSLSSLDSAVRYSEPINRSR